MRITLASLFVILLIIGLSYSVNPISQCTNISYPGSYQFSQNLVGANITNADVPNPACIAINSSDVLLDCAGHSITGDSVSEYYGIAVALQSGPVSNVTIENCIVSNYTNLTGFGSSGIFLNDTSNNLVNNNTLLNDIQGVSDISGFKDNITNNNASDTSLNNAYSEIWLYGSSQDFVANNMLYNTTKSSASGITVQGNFANITNNIGYNLSSFLNAQGTSNNYFYYNSANNTRIGAFFFLANYNILVGNNFTVGLDGIELASNNINSWNYNNSFIRNTFSSFSNVGIYIADSNNTLLEDNHVFNNSNDVQVSSHISNMPLVMNSTSFDNPSGDFTSYTNLSITDLVKPNSSFLIDWSMNSAPLPPSSTSFAGKFVKISNMTPNLSIDSVSWNWLSSETTGYTPASFQLWDYNGSTWSLLNSSPDTANNRISMTNLMNFSLFGILQNNSLISSCANISVPGSYILSQNLTGGNITVPIFSPTCISIQSSNVSLDCNGHYITNNGSATSAFFIGQLISDIAIRNCPGISGYPEGMYSLSVTNSIYQNITIKNSTGVGFFITSNDNAQVLSNNAYNDGEGIFLYGTNDTVSNNFVCNNGQGFRLTGFYSPGDNDTFRGNTICNSTNEGLYASLTAGPLLLSSSDDHFFGNNPDVGIHLNANLNILNDIFDNPAGTYANFTNLSLVASNTSFALSYSAQPAALPPGYFSFAGKFLKISNLTNNISLQSVTWNWLSSEVVPPFVSSKFQLWDYNGSTWSALNTSPDTTNNLLSLANLSSFSTFAILQQNITALPSSGGGPSPGGNGYIKLSETQVCPGNQVNISSVSSLSHAPVPGAAVSVWLNGVESASGITAQDGSALLKLNESGYYTIKATANGYSDGSGGFGYSLCSATAQCMSNSDCPSTESCQMGQCSPVSCNGTVVNHACMMNQTQNQTPQCTSDSQCADSQSCQGGSCKQVMGSCGYATNHTFVKYQCGSEPSCPSCPGGQSCLNNQCVPQNVSCSQSSVTVGSQVSCSCSPAQSCSIIVMNPDGSNTTLQTTNGQGQFTPTSAGEYQLVSGQAMAQVMASAPPQNESALPPTVPAPTTPTTTTTTPPADYSWLLWVVLLIIVLGAGYWYWRSRKK